jgi:hypothetical protein
MTTTTNPHPHVPNPAGAVRVCEWHDVATPTPGRYFTGSSWVVERENRDTDIMVLVDGNTVLRWAG